MSMQSRLGLKSNSTITRISLFIRSVGIIFVALGLAIAYSTFTTPLVPPLLSLFYLISAVFLLSGLFALLVKIE